MINRIINRLGNGFITVIIIVAIINFLLSYYYIIFVTNFYNTYILDLLTTKLSSTYFFNNIIYTVLIGLYLFVYMILFLSIVKRLNIKEKYLFSLSNLNLYLLLYIIVSMLYVSDIVTINFIGFFYLTLPLISLIISFGYTKPVSFGEPDNIKSEIGHNNHIIPGGKDLVGNKDNDINNFMNKIEKDLGTNKEQNNKLGDNNPFSNLNINKLGEDKNIINNTEKKEGLFSKMKGFISSMFEPDDNNDVIIPKDKRNLQIGPNNGPLLPNIDNNGKGITIDDLDNDLFDIDSLGNEEINQHKENFNGIGQNNNNEFNGFDRGNENGNYIDDEDDFENDNRPLEEKLDLDKILSTDSSQIEEVLGEGNNNSEYDGFLLDEDDEDDFINIEEKGIDDTKENNKQIETVDDANVNPTKLYVKGFNVSKTQELEKLEEFIYKL